MSKYYGREIEKNKEKGGIFSKNPLIRVKKERPLKERIKNKKMLMLGKLIGAGCALTGLAGGAKGIGLVFAAYINGVSRNPSLKAELFNITILGFALVEAKGLFSLKKSLMILFAF
ncbi:ATP synthase F(0) complex subunit C2, mitochondrial [Globomyces sp. JEL0801]|nr:ATP synthase F(0) complex subunit C2, mitochondrial [Globomyces sp. JEL0801]